MTQSFSGSLLAADNADDILRFLALGMLKNRETKTKAQPNLNVITLFTWLPDNDHRFALQGEKTKIENTPIYAAIKKKAGTDHYSFETFRLLRDCFDAGNYVVKFTQANGIEIDEPSDVADARDRAYKQYRLHILLDKDTAESTRRPETSYRQLIDYPFSLPRPDEIVTNLSGILRPLNRQKFEREVTILKEHTPEQGLADANAVSEESLIAIGQATMSNQIETTHRFWLVCREQQPRLKHPLSAIVRAWLEEWICIQDAKHITPEFDQRRPVAILKQESMGSIRDLVFTPDEGNSVSSELLARPAPKEKQLTFWTPVTTDTKLPDILPFELYQHGLATTKSAAVAMPVRLAFEALLQMGPGTHSERLHWQLGDLIDYLNPDGKFNWTNQLGYILDGLSALYWLRFPYTPTGEGEVDWIPFLPRTVPNLNSNRESRIIIEVSLPPDISAHGMMVEKNIVRLLGKKSSARFNAYLTACWIFDHYGTFKGKIIDPTIPEERRNEQGELVDLNNKPILSAQGKPVTNVKSKEAARALSRIANPEKDRYPFLNNDDLIRACYPKGVPREQRREYLRRAKKAWTELESDSFIRIERHNNGWRIMPSEQHVSLYRATQLSHNK